VETETIKKAVVSNEFEAWTHSVCCIKPPSGFSLCFSSQFTSLSFWMFLLNMSVGEAAFRPWTEFSQQHSSGAASAWIGSSLMSKNVDDYTLKR